MMATYKIDGIAGIDAEMSEKLKEAGVETTGQLLQLGSKPASRRQLAEATNLSEGLLLKFTHLADLCRVKGVAPDFMALLEASGVDSVSNLAQRNAINLTKKMDDLNQARKLAYRSPTVIEVNNWVEEARTLPRVIEC